MPGVMCVLVMMEGFEVSMRSRMLPDSMRVGSFTGRLKSPAITTLGVFLCDLYFCEKCLKSFE